MSAVSGGLDALLDTSTSDESSPLAHQTGGTHYPGGVTVTDTQVITHDEVFPRFVSNPTNVAIRSGSWNDPATWTEGRVPTNSARVSIPAGVDVTFAVVSNVRLAGLEISGSLTFSSQVYTRMIVGNLMVMPNGRLQIGSASSPVRAGARAELVFADMTIDLAKDPSQYGTGLIALGKVTIHGAQLDTTWARLAVEPKAGDRSLLLSESAAQWRNGDRLILPDTRQVHGADEFEFTNNTLEPRWEVVWVDRVEGNRVILTDPLQFDHLGARNTSGQLELLPHVALLDRNVVIRSENPNGTRGHTLFTARADVDIRFAQFQDLGRTDAFRKLDNTTFDANGGVTHLGTNQIGRYAVHFHHLIGPENPTNTDYQFEFVGNTVERSKKWAVAIHGASYGLLDQNVVYDAQGSGFVTEDGSESDNAITNNITIRIQGTHEDGKSGTEEKDYGRGGVGFWFRRGGNAIVGNVAADSTYAGFVFDGYFTGAITLPIARGADKEVPGQGIVTELSPATWFIDNEAYGLTTFGMWAAYVSGNNLTPNSPETYVEDLRIWNVHHSGVYSYHTNRLTFNNLLILGDLSAQDRNDTGPVGMYLTTYENFNLSVRFSRIEGMRIGFLAPTNDATVAGIERPTVIEHSLLKNYINIQVSPPQDNRPSAGNVLVVRNVRFELVTTLPNGPLPPDKVVKPANIRMVAKGEDLQWTQPSIVRVYNYNLVVGDNFQVFYKEQAASFVLPKTDTKYLSGRSAGIIGSPVAGLTNAQNWAQFGLAMAGAVAPANATTRAGIDGLVGAIQNLAALTPRVVLVTPWDGAIVQGNQPVRIRYNMVGLLPAGAKVFFQLDNGTPFSELKDDGIFNVKAGNHVLRAYVGNASGQLWPGISISTYQFTVRL